MAATAGYGPVRDGGPSRAAPYTTSAYDTFSRSGASGDRNAFEYCNVHQKKRSVSAMDYDSNTGFYTCQKGQECKESMAQQGSFVDTREWSMCSLHQKKRSRDILVDDGRGGLMCTEANGQQCKMGGAPGGPAAGFSFPAGTPSAERPDKAMCALHQKIRSMAFLTPNGMGGYQCAEGSLCKGGHMMGDYSAMMTQGMVPQTAYPLPQRTEAPNFYDKQLLCGTHGKMRNITALVHDGMGGFMCGLGQECKEPGSGFLQAATDGKCVGVGW